MKHAEESGLTGFTVYFVYDASVILPRTGEDVIVFIYGDERRRAPPYLDAVHAVLTVYGTRPVRGRAPLLSGRGLLEAADLARRVVPWLPGYAREQLQLLSGRRHATVHHVPGGYQKLTMLPMKPLAERRNVLSFVGSLAADDEYRVYRSFGTPKLAARRELVQVLRELEPRLPVTIDLTKGYQESLTRGGDLFSEVLMDTKICPVPRGTCLETGRYYGAACFGCIIVAEGLPDRWFFRESPALRVRSWRELPSLVDRLLADPDEMESLHQRHLAWWRDVCSEKAVGRHLAAALRDPARSGGDAGRASSS